MVTCERCLEGEKGKKSSRNSREFTAARVRHLNATLSVFGLFASFMMEF